MGTSWRRLFLVLAAFALLCAACGGPTPSGPVTITLLPGTPPPVASAPPITTLEPLPTATVGTATAEFELFVTGGPAEGEYRAVVNGTSCIRASQEQLAANYADPFAADGFTALDLAVRDVPAALTEETADFSLRITVPGATYELDPAAGEGDGALLLEIDPTDNATLNLSATAADGAEIELTLQCVVEAL